MKKITLKEAVEERMRCEDLETGFEYFLSHYVLLTESGTGKLINFVPWDIQKEVYIKTWVELWRNQRECCDKNITPKKNGIIFMASRQCGKTQLTEALCVWLMVFFPNYTVMHLNKDQKTAKNIILEIHDMIDKLPSFLKPSFKRDTKDEGFTLDNDSKLMIEASKSTNKKGDSAKGRSYRPNLVWIDEAAFVDLGEHLSAITPATSRSFLTSLQSKIPYGMIFTSTPNGRTGVGKRFYDEWMACKTGDPTSLIAISYTWDKCPGYDDEWFKTVCAGEHCTPEHPTAKVNQEYNLMFISNDKSLFTDDIMQKLQNPDMATKPIKEERVPDGYIKWFDIPDPNKCYLVGIDTATMDGSDFSTVQVIESITEDQVCEGKFKCQVNTFCNTYIPQIIGKIPQRLLIIEKNGVGNQTIEILSEKYRGQIYGDYTEPYKPKYGIVSNTQTRKLCVEQIFELCTEHTNNMKSYELRLEATSLERRNNGRIEGVPHDDLCFAFGWVRYVLVHDSTFVIRFFRNRRYEHNEDELMANIEELNTPWSDSRTNLPTGSWVKSGLSNEKYQLVQSMSLNYSDVTGDELTEMFNQYGSRSFRHSSDEDNSIFDVI